MKLFKPVLLLLAVALAFLAGYQLAKAQMSKPLQVLYMGDDALFTASAEEQLLALIRSDPAEDALLAFCSKDFRRIAAHRDYPDPRFPKDHPGKFLPFGNDYIRSFGQLQANMLAGQYADAYNEALAKLISNPPPGAPVMPKASPMTQQTGSKP